MLYLYYKEKGSAYKMYYTRIGLRKRGKKERKEKISLGFAIAILILVLVFLLFCPIAYLSFFTNTKRALTFFVAFQLLTVFFFCWGIFIKIVSSILLLFLDSWKAIFFYAQSLWKISQPFAIFNFTIKMGLCQEKVWLKLWEFNEKISPKTH